MVIFTGGSWGVGEWKFNALSGLGVAHYFNEHETTVNLCRSGISSATQLDNLQEFLGRYNLKETDSVYWLVHNPLVGIETCDLYQNCTTLENSITDQVYRQLAMANDLAHQHNIVIHLVGASCDLNTIDMSRFDRLLLKVPSWGKLLVDTYPVSIISHQADHLINLKDELTKHRPDLLDEYFNVLSSAAFKKRRFMQNNEDMFHSFHPTSLGHRKLRDYLCSDEAFYLHNTRNTQ